MMTFENMTAAERRVAIAKDVIAQLDAGAFNACAGVYLGSFGGDKCEACAIGGAFMSVLRLRGMATPTGKEFVSSSHMFGVLEEYFDYDLESIEEAFEDDDGEWFAAFPDDTDRMRAIMRSIVESGDFRIDRLPAAQVKS